MRGGAGWDRWTRSGGGRAPRGAQAGRSLLTLLSQGKNRGTRSAALRRKYACVSRFTIMFLSFASLTRNFTPCRTSLLSCETAPPMFKRRLRYRHTTTARHVASPPTSSHPPSIRLVRDLVRVYHMRSLYPSSAYYAAQVRSTFHCFRGVLPLGARAVWMRPSCLPLDPVT